MRPPHALSAAPAMLAVLFTAGGCLFVPKSDLDQANQQLEQTRAELRKVTESRDGLQAVVIDQQKQLRSLQRLGHVRLEKLFHVERIELGRYTGPIDTNNDGAQDAIKVYLRPLDRAGHTIKAAGDVKIRLFDLAADPKQNLIGEYSWTADKIADQWSSSFMTYHFSFVCAWKDGPPAHDQVTVRVEFVDYLTGKHFSAQKVCKVKPAPPPAK